MAYLRFLAELMEVHPRIVSLGAHRTRPSWWRIRSTDRKRALLNCLTHQGKVRRCLGNAIAIVDVLRSERRRFLEGTTKLHKGEPWALVDLKPRRAA